MKLTENIVTVTLIVTVAKTSVFHEILNDLNFL
jgi:hypothetical protein